MKKKIVLLDDLDYSDVRPANSIRPLDSPEIATLDNSVRYPKGKVLEVERDEVWEAHEPHEGETWFKSTEHPSGFRVPNDHFRYIDPAED